MASSQDLNDSLLKAPSPSEQGLYDEKQRLALEVLLSKGTQSYQDFIHMENIPDFLSDDEVRVIEDSRRRPRICGDSLLQEQSISESQDCSSVVYSPEKWEEDPPELDLGWPGFTSSSYRGLTRAVAYFQPSQDDCIYSCKVAVRQMICSAKEVIAIVTDSLTDLDILKDLHNACEHRGVPVYILLDESCAFQFLKMCKAINICLDDIENLRVRLINGQTFCTRSGEKVTGKVHERFMLIDGLRVATGSYRYNWTDGRLNSSNLIVLSGQIAETFDLEFRMLYAQSVPIKSLRALSVRGSSHLPLSSPYPARDKMGEMACSTPANKPCSIAVQLDFEIPTPDHLEAVPEGDEILAGCTTSTFPVDQLEREREKEEEEEKPVTHCRVSCNVSTQTSQTSFTDSAIQTDPDLSTPVRMGPPCPGKTLKTQAVPNPYQRMEDERQRQITKFRSSVDRLMSIVSERREFADISNLTGRPSRQRVSKDSAKNNPGAAC